MQQILSGYKLCYINENSHYVKPGSISGISERCTTFLKRVESLLKVQDRTSSFSVLSTAVTLLRKCILKICLI